MFQLRNLRVPQVNSIPFFPLLSKISDDQGYITCKFNSVNSEFEEEILLFLLLLRISPARSSLPGSRIGSCFSS